MTFPAAALATLLIAWTAGFFAIMELALKYLPTSRVYGGVPSLGLFVTTTLAMTAVWTALVVYVAFNTLGQA